MKLSIIIPYFNTEKFTRELLECLDRQMQPEVEVILVDDGSEIPFKADYDWLKIKRKKNGGASSARNKGLDLAAGEYIAFIDSDDLVADNYIDTILRKIREEQFDYCYMSWKTMPGRWSCQVKLNSIDDEFPAFNLCVWNRIYKADLIGSLRFNTKKAIAEDAEFIRKIKEHGKKAFISDFMYLYRSELHGSLTQRFAEGRLDMNRIVYNIFHVTPDMTHLIDEFKEADKDSEVILMTMKNEIPELAEYAMVMAPDKIKGTELRGEPTKLFTKIVKPEHIQVVIWTRETFTIGGIETFTYNFCKHMHKYYDIVVMYEKMDGGRISRLEAFVECRRYMKGQTVTCDTVIVNRITDTVPDEIVYKQRIQMVHACKMMEQWTVPAADHVVAVSEVAAKTFPELKEFTVINNMTWHDPEDSALLLISATRTQTFEKGMKRMADFGRLLEKRGIPFVWLYFADGPIRGAAQNMIQMPPTMDIQPFIQAADYLVQLSDAEGFCYSIVEALEAGTPVLTTPIPVLEEIGFEDGVNGYTLPFVITDDLKLDRILLRSLKGFEYKYDNEARVKQWRKILGNTKPKRKYNPKDKIMVRIVKPYYDMYLSRDMRPGEQILMVKDRAEIVSDAGYGVITGGRA